jgi:hypothetical protein
VCLISPCRHFLQILAYHVVPDVAINSTDLTDGQKLSTLDDSQNLTVKASQVLSSELRWQVATIWRLDLFASLLNLACYHTAGQQVRQCHIHHSIFPWRHQGKRGPA